MASLRACFFEACPACQGTGLAQLRHPPNPDAGRCPACHGEGQRLKAWRRWSTHQDKTLSLWRAYDYDDAAKSLDEWRCKQGLVGKVLRVICGWDKDSRITLIEGTAGVLLFTALTADSPQLAEILSESGLDITRGRFENDLDSGRAVWLKEEKR